MRGVRSAPIRGNVLKAEDVELLNERSYDEMAKETRDLLELLRRLPAGERYVVDVPPGFTPGGYVHLIAARLSKSRHRRGIRLRIRQTMDGHVAIWRREEK